MKFLKIWNVLLCLFLSRNSNLIMGLKTLSVNSSSWRDMPTWGRSFLLIIASLCNGRFLCGRCFFNDAERDRYGINTLSIVLESSSSSTGSSPKDIRRREHRLWFLFFIWILSMPVRALSSFLLSIFSSSFKAFMMPSSGLQSVCTCIENTLLFSWMCISWTFIWNKCI